MGSGTVVPLDGGVEVDESVVGGKESGVAGRKNVKKQLIAVGLERQGSGVGRIFMHVLKNGGSKELKRFFEQYVAPTARVRTDKWRGYTPLTKLYTHLIQEASGNKGSNFKLMHRVIMMVKAWLRGTHHAVRYLQYYLWQYVYRYNQRGLRGDIFGDLMTKMVHCYPVTHKQINPEFSIT